MDRLELTGLCTLSSYTFPYMSRKVICSAINDCLGFYINEIGDSDVTSSLLDGDLILRNIVCFLLSELFSVIIKDISGYHRSECGVK